MRLKRYVVTDNQGFPGTVFLTGIMPIDWTVNGGVLWKRGFRGLVLMGWSDVQNANGFYVYPSQHFRAVGNGPGTHNFNPGRSSAGSKSSRFRRISGTSLTGSSFSDIALPWQTRRS